MPYDVAEYKVVGLNVLFPLSEINKLSNTFTDTFVVTFPTALS